YAQHLRKTIQMDTTCARYDSGLFYTLRPGQCEFSNVEFTIPLSVNSLGVRDDEADLEGPSVIFLGDSFTMGWGIEQDSTFASRIGRELGIKSLNAGISSYGTARELKLLSRLDLSNVKAIFLQYHESDLEENKSYAENSDRLKIGSDSVY